MQVARVVAAYLDPRDELIRERHIGHEDLHELVAEILELHSERGHPAVAIRHPNGSRLSIGTDGELALLVWVDPLEESSHSVGGRPGPSLVFDYFGSWSETPHESLVPLEEAVTCAQHFIRHGAPGPPVLFESD